MQCEKSYFFPSAAPILFNLFWMIGIGVSYQYPPATAMTILSLFIVLACIAQWAFTLPKMYSILNTFQISHLWKKAKFFSQDVRKLAKPLAFGIIGIGASQINNALDAIFARWANEEGPAFLWYAIRIQQLPLALFGIALANALLPPLARAGKNGDSIVFQKFLDFAIKRTLLMMIPLTLGLFILGEWGIRIIYGHGDFTEASVMQTTYCLWGYAAGLIPMALILVLAPAFYSKGDYKTPAQASVGSMVVNAGLNAILIAGFDLGAVSVAVATSVSAWINLFWLGIAIARKSL